MGSERLQIGASPLALQVATVISGSCVFILLEIGMMNSLESMDANRTSHGMGMKDTTNPFIGCVMSVRGRDRNPPR